MSAESKLVIGVPGNWADHTAIVNSIATNSGGYLFVGALMSHVESKEVCKLEVYDRAPDLLAAYTLAGCGKISDDDLAAIGDHSNALYVSGPSNSPDSAKTLMRFAAALLDCGGIAVKIESTGIAHSAQRWRELTQDGSPPALMRAFVTYVGSAGSFYSCGMHNLGLPDATLEADVMPETAATLLDTFLLYLISESPEMSDDETFAIDDRSPRYTITKAECTEFPPGNLFHNPHGVWQLRPVKSERKYR
ncbi:DUF4261 domain-containing protein [Planctomycetes bacterium K23_9]|uniref:Uncharacterized protein n=1 Tax=Stieleria marina TaxID=1930275 RepID=A0A517NUQ5_9BACT|nr:hypothetical protein K239x_28490 [Planctomycetes bacterium K23_9]